MKSSTYNQVIEFHQKFGHPAPDEISQPNEDTIKLRLNLILEEYIELVQAFGKKDSMRIDTVVALLEEADGFISNITSEDIDVDMVEVADALGDIKYVTDGSAAVCGLPFDAISTEIHRSNMSKLGPDGQVMYREDGKIMKGPEYTKPNIALILDNTMAVAQRIELV